MAEKIATRDGTRVRFDVIGPLTTPRQGYAVLHAERRNDGTWTGYRLAGYVRRDGNAWATRESHLDEWAHHRATREDAGFALVERLRREWERADREIGSGRP